MGDIFETICKKFEVKTLKDFDLKEYAIWKYYSDTNHLYELGDLGQLIRQGLLWWLVANVDKEAQKKVSNRLSPF